MSSLESTSVAQTQILVSSRTGEKSILDPDLGMLHSISPHMQIVYGLIYQDMFQPPFIDTLLLSIYMEAARKLLSVLHPCHPVESTPFRRCPPVL